MAETTAAHHPSTSTFRSRPACFAALIALMLLGLTVRARPQLFPGLISTYLPDILWATLVFTLVVAVKPALSTPRAVAYALAIAYFMECSQLYQAPWVNAIRATRVGGLLLGYAFLWSDILCYTIGIALGAALDVLILRQRHRSKPAK